MLHGGDGGHERSLDRRCYGMLGYNSTGVCGNGVITGRLDIIPESSGCESICV